MKDNQDGVRQIENDLAGMLGYNPVWYWMMIFIVLSIIMLTLFFYLKVKRVDEPKAKPALTGSIFYAGEIDKAFLMVSNRAISPQEACQRVSIILREFLQAQTGLQATTMTITELQKVQAPPRVIENLKYLYPVVFGNKQIATYEEFLNFMNSSRAVIDGKWN